MHVIGKSLTVLVVFCVWIKSADLQGVCTNFNSDSCGCRKNRNCEYNLGSNQCLARAQECRAPVGKQCRLAGVHVFYSISSVICWSSVAYHDCSIEKTIWGINFNGKGWTDINGIEFKADFLPDNSDMGILYSWSPMTGVPSADMTLYSHFTWSDIGRQNKCWTYRMASAGDGQYVLTLRMGEHYLGRLNEPVIFLRDFYVQLNQQYVLHHFDPIVYRPIPHGFDVNANFKIYGNEKYLQFEERQPITLPNIRQNLEFKICTGQCPWDSSSYYHNVDVHIGAAAVAKYR